MKRACCVLGVGCLVFVMFACNGAIEEVTEEVMLKNHKRSMADMRTIATAVGAYAVDNGFYPRVSSLQELQQFVQPIYVKTLPMEDAWGTPFSFSGDAKGNFYTLVSFGRNKVADGTVVDNQTGDLDCDIVHMNGVFVQWPEGAQTW